MTDDSRHSRVRLIAYIGLAVAGALGLWRVEDRASDADRAATAARQEASDVDRQARQTATDLAAIQVDRVARLAARCEQDHRNFVAAQQAFAAQQTILDLIDGLVNQSNPDDPKVAAILTPDQLAFLKEQRAKSQAKVSDARDQVDTARNTIEANDCNPGTNG